jgi:hypothetical protein
MEVVRNSTRGGGVFANDLLIRRDDADRKKIDVQELTGCCVVIKSDTINDRARTRLRARTLSCGTLHPSEEQVENPPLLLRRSLMLVPDTGIGSPERVWQIDLFS